MSLEKNRAIVRRFVEEVQSQHNLHAFQSERYRPKKERFKK